MRSAIFILLAVVSLSCGDLKPKEVDLYYNIQSLMVEQAAALTADKVELQKFAIVNGDSSTSAFVPDSLGWADEFQIIMDADINKPALRGQYSISEGDDENSNLKILAYTANSETLPIQSFKVFYLDKVENLKRIEVRMKESNSIFQASKNIILDLDDIKNQNRITHYSIKGFQKMLLQDRVDFNVRCSLKY
ncbi:hypothetical protein [Fulvivirga lutimaris]|uniref:hypothetical protein n=1 Tax=Fulvivirga lutimaris TaxID=1819566 RepID=UPI0012BBC418|nr:hypothetical protein [Fulvivirga lutimaris]MTI41065.1 hypothetical protein [Fulvivirga lutimaris]